MFVMHHHNTTTCSHCYASLGCVVVIAAGEWLPPIEHDLFPQRCQREAHETEDESSHPQHRYARKTQQTTTTQA